MKALRHRYLPIMLFAAVGWLAPALAGNAPAEGTIWDYNGKSYFGDPVHNVIMVDHGHLVEILDGGDQMDLGSLTLDDYGEYVVPSQFYKNRYPTIGKMTFRFSADFSSVRETMIEDTSSCVAGNCNSVDTADFTLRQ